MVTEGVIDGRVLGCEWVCRTPFPGSAGGAGVSAMVGFLEALKEFDSTEKHLHTLQDMVVWEREEYRLVPGFGRDRIFEAHWCPLCGTDVLHECHHGDDGSSLGDRVGVG